MEGVLGAILEQFFLKDGRPHRKSTGRLVEGSPRKRGNYRVVNVTVRPKVATTVLLHRLVFALREGYLPPLVDHRNGNTEDDHADNLRAATKVTNGQNSKRYVRRVHDLPRGVLPVRRKGSPRFAAAITNRGKKEYLGNFPSASAASEAVEQRLRQLHEEFYRP